MDLSRSVFASFVDIDEDNTNRHHFVKDLAGSFKDLSSPCYVPAKILEVLTRDPSVLAWILQVPARIF